MFDDGCSQRICVSSLIFNWKLVEAESRILKQSSEQRERQGGKMFTNASGKVSIGFTYITSTTACTWKLVRLASWFGAKVPIPAGYDRESLSSSSLANNRLMDVTQLALTWLGWPNGEKLALTWIAWKFDLNQSEFKLSRVNARAGKAWPNVVPSRSQVFNLRLLATSFGRGFKLGRGCNLKTKNKQTNKRRAKFSNLVLMIWKKIILSTIWYSFKTSQKFAHLVF